MIFGMPQESIRTGAVDEILPAEAIPTALENVSFTCGERPESGAL